METTEVSINKWMDKNVTYACVHKMKYYSVIKKNGILPFVNTDRPRGYSVLVKPTKERQILYENNIETDSQL